MPTLSDHKLTMLSILTSIIALLLVGLVIWVFLSTQEQVQDLQLKLQSMRTNLENADSLQPELKQIHEHIRRIEEKLASMEIKTDVSTKPTMPIKSITPNTVVQVIEQKENIPRQSNNAATKHWMVIIASFDSLKKAKLAQASKKMSELHSNITMVKLKHGTWYRIVRTGFEDKKSALDFAKKIKHLGFRDAWIQHRP